MSSKLQNLRESVWHRIKWKSVDEIMAYTSWMQIKPDWLRILENSWKMVKTRNDEKRIHLPIPESDQVIAFLSKAKDLVSTIVIEDDNVNADSNDTFYDGGQWLSLRIENKEQYLLTLLWFIEGREIPEDFDYANSYKSLESFKSIEELYSYLRIISDKQTWTVVTEEQFKEFVLEQIPWYAWDIGLSKDNLWNS